MDIEKWLEDFERTWKKKNVESVLELFTDDVDYYETPFEKLDNKEDLKDEWRSVKDQQELELETEIFSREDGKFTVKWNLRYTKNGEQNILKGIYLIKLNSDNKCYEFWQYASLK